MVEGEGQNGLWRTEEEMVVAVAVDVAAVAVGGGEGRSAL